MTSSHKLLIATVAGIAGVVLLLRWMGAPNTAPSPATAPASVVSPEANPPVLRNPSPPINSTDPVPEAEPVGEPELAVESAGEDAPLDYEYRGATRPMTPDELRPGIDAGNEWERAFAREERDDAWARPLETEIQQSLEPEVSMGRFYVSRVECRTTLCEIRLLARGSLQKTELELFQSRIYELPWASRLTPALSSGTESNGDTYESIVIFEKKPE